MNDYPALRRFFGAYLHEDWPDEFPDEWAAADEFVRGEPQAAPDFGAEIGQLLMNCLEEDQLRHVLLYDFGAAIMIERRGWKYRDWLQAIADHVQKAIEHPQAS